MKEMRYIGVASGIRYSPIFLNFKNTPDAEARWSISTCFCSESRRSLSSDRNSIFWMVSRSFSYLRLCLVLIVVNIFFIAESSLIERGSHHGATPFDTSVQILATSKWRYPKMAIATSLLLYLALRGLEWISSTVINSSLLSGDLPCTVL